MSNQTIALHTAGVRNLALGKLLPKHLWQLGKNFNLRDEAVLDAVQALGRYLPDALTAIEKSEVGNRSLKTQLIEKMEKRWNGSFALTGQRLLKKQSKDAKPKS